MSACVYLIWSIHTVFKHMCVLVVFTMIINRSVTNEFYTPLCCNFSETIANCKWSARLCQGIRLREIFCLCLGTYSNYRHYWSAHAGSWTPDQCTCLSRSLAKQPMQRLNHSIITKSVVHFAKENVLLAKKNKQKTI